MLTLKVRYGSSHKSGGAVPIIDLFQYFENYKACVQVHNAIQIEIAIPLPVGGSTRLSSPCMQTSYPHSRSKENPLLGPRSSRATHTIVCSSLLRSKPRAGCCTSSRCSFMRPLSLYNPEARTSLSLAIFRGRPTLMAARLIFSSSYTPASACSFLSRSRRLGHFCPKVSERANPRCQSILVKSFVPKRYVFVFRKPVSPPRILSEVNETSELFVKYAFAESPSICSLARLPLSSPSCSCCI